MGSVTTFEWQTFDRCAVPENKRILRSLAAVADSAKRAGIRRLAARLMRRFRYDHIYSCSLRYHIHQLSLNGNHTRDARLLDVLPGELGFVTSSRSNLIAANDYCMHRFAFLNLPYEDLGTPVDWRRAPNNDRLWQYNLHYGEWALTLAQAFATTRQEHYLTCLINLLLDWIDHNPAGTTPGWEPYPLSRRLVAWSRLHLVLWSNKRWASFWRTMLEPSLRLQAKLLADNLETDLGNNHLIANYRALAWVGLLFPQWSESPKWHQLGLNGLWQEMERQVLADGVHDERSVSYHAIVLQDVLETWWLAQKMNVAMPNQVERTIVAMMQFLVDSQMPDGSWPMMNDSVPDYPCDPREVVAAGSALFRRQEWGASAADGDLGYAAWLSGHNVTPPPATRECAPVAAFAEAGYAVLRQDDKNCVFFDAGAMGPDHLPGHGHADALSFVLYGNGRPMIVDPGVYTYQAGQWRDHFRSTQAHNTVAIDSQDQCVFWGAFRVAYAPAAELIDWSANHVTGEHRGYRRLSQPVYLHRRTVESRTRGEWLVHDSFLGEGEHHFVLTLQFASGAVVELAGDECTVAWPDRRKLLIKPLLALPNAKVRIKDGWISSGWNLKESAPRYELGWRGDAGLESRLLIVSR